jgi:hypothetical protein
LHRYTQSGTNGYANCHANRNVVQGCSDSSAKGYSKAYSEGQADTDATALGALRLLVILIAHSLTPKLKE